MALLNPKPVSTNRFTYHSGTATFVAEASDLGRDPFGRVWDDACDIGLTLVSARTGAQVVFAVAGEARDGEGDLLYWDLLPADRNAPALKVRVYND